MSDLFLDVKKMVMKEMTEWKALCFVNFNEIKDRSSDADGFDWIYEIHYLLRIGFRI